MTLVGIILCLAGKGIMHVGPKGVYKPLILCCRSFCTKHVRILFSGTLFTQPQVLPHLHTG